MRWIGLYEIPIDDPLLVRPGKLCGEDVASGADLEGQLISSPQVEDKKSCGGVNTGPWTLGVEGAIMVC